MYNMLNHVAAAGKPMPPTWSPRGGGVTKNAAALHGLPQPERAWNTPAPRIPPLLILLLLLLSPLPQHVELTNGIADAAAS